LAIPTSGDLILDVVRAADPAAAEAARTRLASFAAKAQGATFDAAAATGEAPRGKAATGAATGAATPDAFARFEAMVLQSFIQTMLPEDTESVYGGGMAGEMWQSMLAEQLGTAVARRGGIGIAERILRDRYVAGEQSVPVQGVSADPGKPALDEQRLLSTALIHEIQRRATGTLANTLDGAQPSSSDTETR